MKFLAITRAVVGFATSLHLSSLKLGIQRMEAKVATAVRQSDTAVTIKRDAERAWNAAAADLTAARRVEQAAKADLAGFIGAAKIEADGLRTDHGIGG